MRYRKLSPTGDYSFGSGPNDFYINVPMAPGQAVKTRLELFQGEWFLDNSVGTPYLTNVLGKHSQQMADAAIKDVVNNTQGITAISQFVSAMNSQTRYYSVQMVVQTIYGPTPVQMANYQNY